MPMNKEDILEQLNDIVDDLVGNTHLDYEGVSPPSSIPELASIVMRTRSMSTLRSLIKELNIVKAKLTDTIKILQVEERRRDLMHNKSDSSK